MKNSLVRVARVTLVVFVALAAAPAARAYDWRQFNGNSAHSGNNVLEKGIDRNNVSTLTLKFQATLPAPVDGAPVLVRNVLIGAACGPVNCPYTDLLFVTTTAGHLVGIDAQAGTVLFIKQYGPGQCKINNGFSTCFTTSSPAIDPSGWYVYTYGLDGYVHKVNTLLLTEDFSGGFPQLATKKAFDEKGSSALSLATSQGTTYLYMTHGGYPGDNGDYQGHVTAINLTTGAQNVFNSMCSDQAVHLNPITGSPPNCAFPRSAMWARPGVIYDASLDRIFIGTGNGSYNGATSGTNWSETILALHPDGTGGGGEPLDSYTPTTYQSLDNLDLDLGSAAPAILPVPPNSNVQHLAVQTGKDGQLRLVDLANLSGEDGPGHTGGEIGSVIPVPQGATVVLTQPAVWVNPADHRTWVFVANGSGISGLRLQIGDEGNPSLAPMWQVALGGTSPLVANNILYYAADGAVRALDPTTGSGLWTSSGIGGIHWGSPIVANGKVYMADMAGHLTAFAPAYLPAPYDFNANGKTDLLWSNDVAGYTASWLMDGLSATSIAALMTDPNWRISAVGDFNGDDKADLLWRNAATGQEAIWLMNGSAVTAAAIVFADPDWSVVATGDFNGDGKTDLVWRNATTGQTAIWLMNGINASAAAVVYADPNWRVIFTGDFDGDGKSDLVWSNSATGQIAIWLMDGLTPKASAIVFGDPTWSLIATGDFNGDGKTDLLWHSTTTGQSAIWLMDGLTASAVNVIGVDPSLTLVATGDFNGDGRTDLVWQSPSGQTVISLMDGSYPFRTAVVYADINWSVIATPDLNGDGKSDLVWRNFSTGQIAAWLMNGVAPTSSAIIYADPGWTVINPSH